VEVKGVQSHLTPPTPCDFAVSRSSHHPACLRSARYELVSGPSTPATDKLRHVEALIEAHGRTNPVSDLIGMEPHVLHGAHARIGKRELKLGARYPFTLAIDAGSVTRDSSHALVRHFASLKRMRSIAGRALGCA